MAGRPATLNPLSMSFGAALRRERGARSTKTIAEAIGIAESFYRLIESGRNHPSVSKSLAIHAAFASLEYEAIVLLLTTIASSEEGANEEGVSRGRRLHENVSAICDALHPLSHPLKAFLRRFVTPLDTYNISTSELKAKYQSKSILECADEDIEVDLRKLVFAARLDDEAHRFLTSFREYNQADQILANEYGERFFKDIPTVYKWMFDGLKKNLQLMPTNFGPDASWDWEGKNSDKFEKLIAICYAKHLADIRNLQRYSFRYLWLDTFHRATFLLLDDDQSPDTIKTRFWTNLAKASERPKHTLDSAKHKTVFRALKGDSLSRALKLLKDVPDADDLPLNAMWFFRTTDDAIIGAASHIDDDTVLAKKIRFLTFEQSANAAAVLNDLVDDDVF